MRKFSKLVAFALALVLMSATFVVSAATPENLMPDDVFANQTNYDEWFKVVGYAENQTTFTKDGDDYVVHIPWIEGPGVTAWQASTQAIPYDSYTVKFYIQPIEGVDKNSNPYYFGCGIMLGYGDGNGGGFPWMNCRFNINYELEVVEWYVWEHTGSGGNGIVHNYSFGWYNGFEFPEDLWFEVIIEVTPEATTFFLNGDEVPLPDEGYTIPGNSLGHYPTSSELKWIGFLPEGSGKDKATGEVVAPSTGFNVKNMGIYEGVNLDLFDGSSEDEGDEPADETEEPADETEAPADTTEAPADTTEAPADETEAPADETEAPEDDKDNKKDKGSNVGLIIGIVAAVVVVAAGAVVAVILIKKKK